MLRPETIIHYGIRENPFSPSRLKSREDVLKTQEHYLASRRIIKAARDCELLLLIGRQGTGKSTALSSAEEELRSTGVDISRFGLADSPSSGTMVNLLIDEMARCKGIAYGGYDRQKKLNLIKKSLQASSHGSLLIAIDDGHVLPGETLLSIKRKWDNLVFGFRHLVGIVILCQESIYTNLNSTGLREFDQHVEKYEMLGLIHPDEVHQYIAKRCEGFFGWSIESGSWRQTRPGAWDSVIDPLVPVKIWELYKKRPDSPMQSDIQQIEPRRLNAIMVGLLNYGAASGAPKITADLVEHYSSSFGSYY